MFDNFIKIKATFSLMHEYPLLFEVWDSGWNKGLHVIT